MADEREREANQRNDRPKIDATAKRGSSVISFYFFLLRPWQRVVSLLQLVETRRFGYGGGGCSMGLTAATYLGTLLLTLISLHNAGLAVFLFFSRLGVSLIRLDRVRLGSATFYWGFIGFYRV